MSKGDASCLNNLITCLLSAWVKSESGITITRKNIQVGLHGFYGFSHLFSSQNLIIPSNDIHIGKCILNECDDM